MDESELAKDLIEQVLASAGGRKIKSITIQVGKLLPIEGGIVTGLLRNATGAIVATEAIPLKIRCSCGYEGEAEVLQTADGNIFACSACASRDAKVLEGDKVQIKSIELE